MERDAGSQEALHRKVRGSKPKVVDIVSLNSSGKPQLEQAFDYYGRSRASAGNAVVVGAILAQEHHALADAWIDLQHRGKAAGWQVQGAQAVPGEGGRGTAGTCVAARVHLGLTRAAGLPFDASPGGSEGRVSVTWVDGIMRGGVAVISVYLWHTEGLSPRNMAILKAAGEAAAHFGGPWIMARVRQETST